MAVIGISVGHGGSDPGAIAYNGKTEAYYNLEIGKRLKALLEKAGHTILISRTSDVEGGEVNFAKSIKGKVDFAIAIHFNAYNKKAQGTECGVNTIKAEQTGTAILKAITKACEGLSNRGSKKTSINSYNFAMLKYDYPCVYLETLFCDAPSAKNWIDTSDKLDNISQAILSGILEIFPPETKRPKPEPKAKTKLVYRVVTGSFEKIENATARKNALEKAGFNSFITAFEQTL